MPYTPPKGKGPAKLTPEETVDVLTRFKNGEHPESIAAEYGMRPHHCANMYRKHMLATSDLGTWDIYYATMDIVRSRGPNPRRKVERNAAIYARSKAGERAVDIASAYNITPSNVFRICANEARRETRNA